MKLNNNLNNEIEYSAEVRDAIDNNLPILVLESTIITHGMPYPQIMKQLKC